MHGRRTGGLAGRMLALGMAAALLSGCGIGRVLGFDESTPDEFQVIARAPLEVPPDYNLRPPQPGSPRPQELERDVRATATVFGAAVAEESLTDPRVSNAQSPGEGAFLAAANADRANADIRAIVDRENPGVVVGERGFLSRLLDFGSDETQAPQNQPVPSIERTASQQIGSPAPEPTAEPTTEPAPGTPTQGAEAPAQPPGAPPPPGTGQTGP